jgi:hypothetical protein
MFKPDEGRQFAFAGGAGLNMPLNAVNFAHDVVA